MNKQVLTMKGYDMFEVISAFQKSIRRGLEDDAMFWGVELYNSEFIPYAWQRMMIISTEDIGLASPNAPVVMQALKQQFDSLYYDKNGNKKFDKKQQCRLPYVQAILYLVHCPKSRHTDWALNYWFDTLLFDEDNKEIPDYALDIHTRRGKQMGKDINDFFSEGSKVNDHVLISKEQFYKEECQKRWTSEEWKEKAKIAKAKIEQVKEGQPINQNNSTQEVKKVETTLFG